MPKISYLTASNTTHPILRLQMIHKQFLPISRMTELNTESTQQGIATKTSSTHGLQYAYKIWNLSSIEHMKNFVGVPDGQSYWIRVSRLCRNCINWNQRPYINSGCAKSSLSVWVFWSQYTSTLPLSLEVSREPQNIYATYQPPKMSRIQQSTFV